MGIKNHKKIYSKFVYLNTEVDSSRVAITAEKYF